MKLVFVIPAVLALTLLSLSLLEAPFAFPMQGKNVYQWPDDRVTLLGAFSVFAILFFAVAARRPTILKLTASACIGLSGSIFFLFVIFNYGTNAPDGLFPLLFSAQAATSAMNIMDGMRLSPVYGLAIQALAWFAALTASAFVMRLPRGITSASVDTGIFASSILAIYALGVHIVIPQWSGRAITGLQNGTAFVWFTNDDLLIVASVAFFVTMAFRQTMRPSRSLDRSI